MLRIDFELPEFGSGLSGWSTEQMVRAMDSKSAMDVKVVHTILKMIVSFCRAKTAKPKCRLFIAQDRTWSPAGIRAAIAAAAAAGTPYRCFRSRRATYSSTMQPSAGAARH